MRFENRIQAETHAKLERYLGELFEDADTDLDPESNHFYVRYGTTVLEISNEPYGPEESAVTIMSYCVQGADLETSLLRSLLDTNHKIPFGCFSLDNDDIYFSHTLFGRTLTRSNLLTAISAVAELADEYDDLIVAKFGGTTALQQIEETSGQRRRASAADLDEDDDER